LRGLAAKRFGELGHIRHRSVHTPAGESVRIAGDLLAFGLGRVFAGPDLSPTQEETLFRCETVNIGRTRFAVERFLKRVVRDRQTGKVADVFAKRQLAVDKQAGLDFVAVKLLDDARCTLVELGTVGVGPPHFEVTVGVETAARIVKPVGDLVADDAADSTVIDRVVSVKVKERRLQDAGGKCDVVIDARV